MTRPSGRRLAVLVAAASTALVLQKGDPAGTEKDAATLTIAVRADVTGFFPNPPFAYEAFTMDVNRSVFETLVTLDREQAVAPGLAESWTNPDERTCVLTLRPGARFSDGRELRAGDAAASLTAARERGWPTKPALRWLESARALDDRRVELRSFQPSLVLLSRLNWGFVVPAESVAETPVPAVGSGPYRLKRWTPGKEILLERNPLARVRAPFAKARIVVMEDDEKRVSLVRMGVADAADHVPPAAVGALLDDPLVDVASWTSPRVLLLVLRLDRPPFSDPRLREAIDLALDRREIRRRVFADHGDVASQIVPCSIVGYDPEAGVAEPDPRRARLLLQEAGISKGSRVVLDGPRNRYVSDGPLLAEVARQLAAIGLDVDARPHEKGAYYDLIDSGASGFHLIGWSCNSGDAAEVLDSVLHSRREGYGLHNTAGLADPALDTLIEEAGRSLDPRARALLLRQALRRAASHRVVLPLVAQPEAVALSRRVAWDPPFNGALRPESFRLAAPTASGGR